MVITVILSIVVTVWNILQFGLVYGLMFSFLHIVGGLATGLVVAGVVFAVIVMVLAAIFGSPSTGGGGTAGIPEIVEDVNTGEQFHVSNFGNGSIMIDRNGNWVPLRSGDYSGRYLDSYGNTYISRE